MSADVSSIVCFDLGGVLVRICRSWEEGCAAAGVDVNRDWSPADSSPAHHALLDAYTIGRITTPTFFRELAAMSGGVYSAEEFRAIHANWIRGVYPGAENLLAELRSAGVETACLSNTNELHWDMLCQWPILERLGRRHASHLVGIAKPDPGIYEWFQRRVERAPEHIVFFDDLQDNIAAARSLEWDAVHVDHAGDTSAAIRMALFDRGLLIE